MSPDGLPQLRDVIEAHGLSPKKSLGQNFLLDLNVTRKIARLARARPLTPFVEVGPGPGGLSRALLMEGVDQLLLVERDERTRPILEEISESYPGRVTTVFEDALKFDWGALTPEPYEIVSNLPYNIGTVLLTQWLSMPWPAPIGGMTLMFQEEVAERIVAGPGSKTYGRLSVLCNWRCDTEIVYRLPREVFTPPPKVTSAVVRLRPKAELEYEPTIETFSMVTAAAFGQRRKMLRASLKSLCSDVPKLLASVGIDPTLRAEALSWQDYCQIALALEGRPVLYH